MLLYPLNVLAPRVQIGHVRPAFSRPRNAKSSVDESVFMRDRRRVVVVDVGKLCDCIDTHKVTLEIIFF